ncbi:MAG: hypothetical protein AAGA55_04330, partial [Planctomycetota bacterium]
LNNSYSAYQRSQAVAMAYEVIDSLRANREQVIQSGIPGGYNDEWDDRIDAMLTNGGIDVDIHPNGTAFFVRVSIAWLDDRTQLSGSLDCGALANANAGASALSADACTRLYMVSEL